jgi:hypothetical protein
MNNFEQNAKFYEDLAQIANKLALIAENRLPITPIERDLTLQLLREAYATVLQCAGDAVIISAPAPSCVVEPVQEAVQPVVPTPTPEPQLQAAPEPVQEVVPEPAPVQEMVPELAVEPEPAPVHEVEPEPVQEVKVELAPEKEPEPVAAPKAEAEAVQAVKAEPIPDILSFLDTTEAPVEEDVPQTELLPSTEHRIEEEKEVTPVRVVAPDPVVPAPAPAPVVPEVPSSSGNLFSEESVVVTRPQTKRSLNDLLGQEDNSLAAKFQHSHIDDLSKAISLNDKFLYIKELFKGKGEDFGKAIQKLNACRNSDEAFQTIDMLKKYYSWDTTSSAYLALCDLVRRKFV